MAYINNWVFNTGILLIAALLYWVFWMALQIGKMKKCEHEYVQYRICDKCGHQQKEVKEDGREI